MNLVLDSGVASDISTADAYRRRIAELEVRLAEAEETLDAIRSGEVDAVVVGDTDSRRVFTLESADRPYRLLIEEMAEGAVTLGADGLILYCNQAFADLVGRPSSQVVGSRFDRFVAEAREPLAELIERGGRTEIVLADADSAGIVATLSLSVLPTEEGRLMCGVVTDLTEARVHARDLADARQDLAVAVARREGEESYRALFNSIDAGFCIIEMAFDEDGRAADYRIIEGNPAFERQTGLVGAQDKWVSELAPDLERHWHDIYGRVALTGEPVRFENHAASLADRWYDVYAYRVGRPEQRHVAVLFNDISDRRRAEAAIRELNETLEQRVAERTRERDRLWESSPDLLLVIDFEGVFRRVNPAWTKLLGYPARELVGRHVNEFVLPDDHAETVDAYELAAAGGRPAIVNRYRHKDGSIRWISWVAAPAGDMTYATGRDITQEKKREAELAQAQEALRQSQKVEAMGQLTGGVAHDFNNLLTPIIGSLDLIGRRGNHSERDARLLDGALQSAERAKVLVQRLLAFARRQPLQPGPVDLAGLVKGMADLIISTSGPQIRIATQVEPDLPLALADANQLEMAILNLAVNARDAMPDGGTLTIAAEREQAPGDLEAPLAGAPALRLSVADTGSGMDAETAARAIEPFFSTKGVGKGTGLGLSMVHGLAQQLGGAMTISSRLGFGTRIDLWLPLSTASPAESSAAAAPADREQFRGRALVVDDEPIVRLTTVGMLESLGYQTEEAESAVEAEQRLRAGERFDLIVTDHLMPGLTGAELARRIRQVWPETRVLIISGYAEVDGIAPDLARLTKPFREAELAAAISGL